MIPQFQARKSKLLGMRMWKEEIGQTTSTFSSPVWATLLAWEMCGVSHISAIAMGEVRFSFYSYDCSWHAPNNCDRIVQVLAIMRVNQSTLLKWNFLLQLFGRCECMQCAKQNLWHYCVLPKQKEKNALSAEVLQLSHWPWLWTCKEKFLRKWF